MLTRLWKKIKRLYIEHWPQYTRCIQCGKVFDNKHDLSFGHCSDDCEGLSYGWLCQCGHWQADGLHCSKCGTRPPFGCDCGGCDKTTLDDLEFLDEWARYPGYLLAQSESFGEQPHEVVDPHC